MSGENCLTLPFRRRFAIAKSRKIVRIESEKSGKCHSKIVHSQRLHALIIFFQVAMVLNQRRRGGFVERKESGIRNPECGIRNPFKFYFAGGRGGWGGGGGLTSLF